MKYLFKITLCGVNDPSVWRKFAVPADYTFKRFHKAIQVAFGWENLHSFEFYDGTGGDGDMHIIMPHEDDLKSEDKDFTDASKTRLHDVFSDNKRRFTYRYDSNDNWTHEIELEEISDDFIKCPQCYEGEGMCPPEGCGGVAGYEHIKMIFREKPGSDEYIRCREWLFMEDDDEFDPYYFTEEEVAEANEIYERYFR